MVTSADIVLDRDEARKIDEVAVDELGMSGLLLMENAARGVCDAVLRNRQRHSRIVIVCGPGNNGGDGLALVRHLAANGVASEVKLLRSGKELSNDANSNLEFLQKSGIAVSEVDESRFSPSFTSLCEDDIIVDCLLGTGVYGAPRQPFADIIDCINDSPARTLAVDVPSGLDCNQGSADGKCIEAHWTVTFVGMKRGFTEPQARKFTGDVTVAHIGLPLEWVCSWLQRIRSANDDGGQV